MDLNKSVSRFLKYAGIITAISGVIDILLDYAIPSKVFGILLIAVSVIFIAFSNLNW